MSPTLNVPNQHWPGAPLVTVMWWTQLVPEASSMGYEFPLQPSLELVLRALLVASAPFPVARWREVFQQVAAISPVVTLDQHEWQSVSQENCRSRANKRMKLLMTCNHWLNCWLIKLIYCFVIDHSLFKLVIVTIGAVAAFVLTWWLRDKLIQSFKWTRLSVWPKTNFSVFL